MTLLLVFPWLTGLYDEDALIVIVIVTLLVRLSRAKSNEDALDTLLFDNNEMLRLNQADRMQTCDAQHTTY